MRNGILLVAAVLFSCNVWADTDSVCIWNMRERIRGAIQQCDGDKAWDPGASAVIIMNTATQGRVNCYYTSGSYREGQAFFTNCGPAIIPPPPKPDINPNACKRSGSIIETSNQVLGEVIPLTGSSFNVEIKNEAGTVIDNTSYVNAPNLTHTYVWNGIDAGSNETWGLVKRTVIVTENASDYTLPPNPKEVFIGSLKAKKLGTGGWLPSVWHFYDIVSGTLFKGDGNFRKISATLLSNGQYRLADESGKEVYYFDSTGKIVETRTSRTGKVIYSFTYDSAGRILTITEPFNRITTFSRYLSGALKAILTPNGTKTSITLNSNGYLTNATNPNSEVYTMEYSGPGGLLTSFTTPSGAVTTLTYDSEGNLTSDSNSSGQSSTLTKTSSGVSLTSAMGRISGNSFDYFSKQEVATNASGFPYSQTTKDDQDYVTSPGVSKIYNYNIPDPRFGSQIRQPSSMSIEDFGSRNVQSIRTATLNDPNDIYSINTLTEITRSLPSESTSVYTGSDRNQITTSKLGKIQARKFDEYERPILEQTGTLAAVDYTYTNDLLTKITQGTRRTDLIYYSNNLLKSTKNDLGQYTTYTYDVGRRVKTKTLPDLRVINYSYDTNGNLTSITPPGKSVHQLEYEVDGMLSNYLPPILSGVATPNTEYTYNNDRQLTKITRPDGEEINYNYNATTGLLTSVSGNSFNSIIRTYMQGRPDNISQGGQSIYLGYNGSMMSFTQATNSLGSSIYRFDRNPSSTFGGKIGQDKITSFFDFSQRTINYQYDNDEYLSKAGDLELTYDNNSQLSGTKLAYIKDYYYYNAFGEIRKYVAKHGLAIIYEYELVRDSLGRITKKSETLNNVLTVFDYLYDTAGRLTQVSTNGVVTSTYTYDSNSNRIGGIIRGENTSASYDDQDRLVDYNGTAFAYNANGELLSKGNATYSYDVFGNLKNYIKGNLDLSYEVDPLQRRSALLVGGSVTTRYAYNPEGQVIAQLDGNNKILKTFVYATKSHVPDYYIDSKNNKFRIITDNLGSVRLVVSKTGRVLQMMEHDEFGRVLQDTRPGFLPFGFAGGLYEYRSGLVRFGARDYDAQLGRWILKDPIRFDAHGTNLYGYVDSSPLNFIDSSGEDYQVCIRPMNGLPLIPHEYIKFSDGGSISWGPSVPPSGPGHNSTNDSGGLCGDTHKTSTEQDRIMKDWANQHEKDNYNVFTNNCFDFVNGAIRAGQNPVKAQ